MTAPRYLTGGRRRRSTLEDVGLLVLVVYVTVALVAAIVVVLWFAIDRASASSRPSSSTVAKWEAVAECETGGDWHMRGSSYSGGVGFANSTWSAWARELGLERRYPNAADAPRLVQIRVADYGRRVHNGYWGCL